MLIKFGIFLFISTAIFPCYGFIFSDIETDIPIYVGDGVISEDNTKLDKKIGQLKSIEKAKCKGFDGVTDSKYVMELNLVGRAFELEPKDITLKTQKVNRAGILYTYISSDNQNKQICIAYSSEEFREKDFEKIKEELKTKKKLTILPYSKEYREALSVKILEVHEKKGRKGKKKINFYNKSDCFRERTSYPLGRYTFFYDEVKFYDFLAEVVELGIIPDYRDTYIMDKGNYIVIDRTTILNYFSKE